METIQGTKNTYMDHHIYVPFPSPPILYPSKMTNLSNTINADNKNTNDVPFTANDFMDEPIKIDLNVKVLSKPKTKSKEKQISIQ